MTQLKAVDLTQGFFQFPDALSGIGPEEFNQNSPNQTEVNSIRLSNIDCGRMFTVNALL